MNRVDQGAIDHIAVRPEVASAGRADRVRGVDQIRVAQDAHRHRRVGSVDPLRHPVIEAVDRHRSGAVPSQTVQNCTLDSTRLHFDVHGRRGACRVEHLIERGDPLTMEPDRNVLKRRPVHGRESRTGAAAGGSGENRVVVDDDHPVTRGVNVQLPAVSARSAGGEEARQGILAMLSRCATVGNERWGRTAGHRHKGEGVEGEGEVGGGLNIARGAPSAYQTEMPDPIRAGDDAVVDGALIARWNAGDQRAATALVERHAGSLTRFVSSLGVGLAPDEIVQDTFVRAFGSLESFRGESSLRSWLFTIARRLVLDQRRAARRERNHVSIEDAQGSLVSGDDVLGGVVADELEGRVREAVARLSPTQREVFTLRVVEGLSYKEIAVVASTTEGAARVHYHNAMRAVKEFLDA